MLSPRCIIAVLAFAFVAPLAAAAPDRPSAATKDLAELGRPALRIYTDQDGLPQNAITALAFDANGFLWVGTKDGAAYYNGRRWNAVRFPPNFGSTLVQAMLASSDGSLWFGTIGGGIARFSGSTWSVHTAENSALPSNEVLSLLETRSDAGGMVITAGTASGIGVYEHGTWTRLPAIPGVPGRNIIKSLHETRDASGKRVLWAGSEASGLSRLSDGVWKTWDIDNSNLTDNRVLQFAETSLLDGRPSLVAATFGGGIIRYSNEDWEHFPGAANIDEQFVLCLRETRNVDGSATLWAGTYRGLARFSGGRWEMLRDRLRIPVPGVWSLLDTPTPHGSRTLWIGTSGGGLARWEMGRWSAITRETGLPDNSVYALLESRGRHGDSVYWIGTNNGGLARHENGSWRILNEQTGSVTQTPVCLLSTPGPNGDDDVWYGSNNEGLSRIRGSSIRVWTRERDGLPHNRVWCLLATTLDDGRRAVLAGTSNGVARVIDDRLEVFDVGALPDVRIQCLSETNDLAGNRTLWIGTPGGLVRVERGGSSVTNARNGLVANSVLCAQEVRLPDGSRELWVGTQGGGLSRLALDDPGASWRPLSVVTTPALPNDTVYQIRQDAAGRIYVFTNKGIARLTPQLEGTDPSQSFNVYVFTTEDGLPSNECNTGASMIDRRGRIWVGTINGAAVFDPSLEVADSTPKRLVIERAILADTGRTISPLAELEFNENHIVFHFSLLSFFRESDTVYRTELEGLDGVPSDWSPDDKKEFTSLPRGEYRFKVWGRDATGVVTGPVIIPFTVKPAPWLTWPAYLLYFSVLAAVVYVAIRIRIASLRRSNRLLEQHIAERTGELANKVSALRESEQLALEARNSALESERRARQSEHKALEASRAKSVFLANMSHELRTPLNAILGFVQLMERDKKVTTDQRSNLGVIMRSGEHLLALINDVLSLSKIEAGRESLDVSAFNLVQLLRGLEEMFRLRAESKGLELRFTVDASVPTSVLGDVSKLRQILINLLGNAVKFTERGCVLLAATWHDGRAVFVVSDTGYGMTEAETKKLFRAFVQTESGARMHEGTGLGLVISRDFAMLMDGDIAVESQIGLGSTFRVEVALPATDSIEHTAGPRRVIALDPESPVLRVLVVDDIAENRTLLERLLTMVGLFVSTASNGREAVEVWERDHPDIVLMDVRMPVMDGIAATREIRQREARDAASSGGPDRQTDRPARTPIIALTASAFDHDRDRILGAGCDDYIPKPFRESVIFEKLAEHTMVRFVHEGDGDEELPEAVPPRARATPGAIAALPRTLLDALESAVTIGDASAALDTIDDVRQSDAELADALVDLVRNYRFDEILDLLVEADTEQSQSIADQAD